MGARERGPLTEAMFYTLMVLAQRDVCGTEIAQAVGYGSEYSFRRAFQRSENCRLQDWVPPEE